MARTTWWDVIIRTIEKVGLPLSEKEIWTKANEINTIGEFVTTGKTPWSSIGAYCYDDIKKNGVNSTIIQVSQRPQKFFLRKLEHLIDIDNIETQNDLEEIKKVKEDNKRFDERDLHHILVSYANVAPHFKANLSTIYHEISNKGTKGKFEWLHPDIVGVYFPFRDYKLDTLEIQKNLSITSIKLFSFELKKSLNFSNLRESYFQAVSNSSWANEGYLVALNVETDPDFINELGRLNNAFGIGIIKLNAEIVAESEIILPSRIKSEIDWETVNRLVSENKNFDNFIKLINEDCKLGKVKSQYDEVLSSEKLDNHIRLKGIKNS